MPHSYYTYKKSSVIGGSWLMPFGTPFFIRWGDLSLKFPMAQLRAEYDAWDKLQLERPSQLEPPKPEPLLSFPSGPFDWAEDVEQELFSTASVNSGNTNTCITLDINTGINLDSKPDIEPIFSPIVDQVVPEGVAVVGAGNTLCAILEESEKDGVTGEDEASDLDSIDLTDTDLTSSTHSTTQADSTPSKDSTPLDDFDTTPLDDPTPQPTSTPSTDTDTTIYRIINTSTTDNAFSLHMVEDDTASKTSKTNASNSTMTSTAQELYEAIQFLGTVSLLNLDTYVTIFDTAVRACAAGLPFWLHDPLGDREILV